METTSQNQSNNSMKNGMIALGVLLLLSLIGLTILLIRGNRKSDDIKALESDKETLIGEYDRVETQRDESQEQVADYQDEIEKLKADHAEQLRNRDVQISDLRARANQASQIPQLKSQIEEFELMQTEYEDLRGLYADLLEENEKLEGEFQIISDQLKELQDSIEGSRDLMAYNISPLTKWERWICSDRYNVSRARRVDQTSISLEVAGTPFSKHGSKTVHLQMLDPFGTIMYTSDETFEIKKTDEQSPFTQQKDIEYTGEPVPMVFTINHPDRLEPGTYRIKVYVEGDLVRSGEIELD